MFNLKFLGMSEIVLGAICKRAIVVEKPATETINGESYAVSVKVRYRHGKSFFSIERNSKDSKFAELLKLRVGDEMYVSYDGEDLPEIIFNPFWKRLWLRLIW